MWQNLRARYPTETEIWLFALHNVLRPKNNVHVIFLGLAVMPLMGITRADREGNGIYYKTGVFSTSCPLYCPFSVHRFLSYRRITNDFDCCYYHQTYPVSIQIWSDLSSIHHIHMTQRWHFYSRIFSSELRISHRIFSSEHRISPKTLKTLNLWERPISQLAELQCQCSLHFRFFFK